MNLTVYDHTPASMPSHSRRASTSRTPSPDDDMDDEDELLSPDDLPSSPTHLVLVQEPEDLPELELWESDSDELESGGRQSEDYPSNSIPRTSQSAHIEPLNTFQILPLLVAPNLKLGAALLLSFSLQRDSLPLSVPGAAITLILLAFLNPLATQIYMMLCQYVGKWTIEGVLGEALFGVSTGGHRGSRQEERRHQSPWKKGVVRAARATVALAGALLCAAYLRGTFKCCSCTPRLDPDNRLCSFCSQNAPICSFHSSRRVRTPLNASASHSYLASWCLHYCIRRALLPSESATPTSSLSVYTPSRSSLSFHIGSKAGEASALQSDRSTTGEDPSRST